MGAACRTCGLTDPACHPCDANGTASPCFDDFHREEAIRKCDESRCETHGLTKKRVWRCAIHDPEHPMNWSRGPSDWTAPRSPMPEGVVWIRRVVDSVWPGWHRCRRGRWWWK